MASLNFLYKMHWLGKWQHVKETTEIGEGKLFSPGNLRATFDNPDYSKVNSAFLNFILLMCF